MKTKRLGIWITFLVLCCVVIVVSCNKFAVKENSNSLEDELLIGSFLKGGDNVELSLSFEEAVSIVKKYNLHISKEYNYHYTEVWIETLVNSDGSTDYYLASRADVTDKNSIKVLSCYTTYFALEKNEGNLLFSPLGGPQYTCTGHCCKSCKLTPATPPFTDPSCECEQPNTECGPAWCDQTVTVNLGGGGSTN